MHDTVHRHIAAHEQIIAFGVQTCVSRKPASCVYQSSAPSCLAAVAVLATSLRQPSRDWMLSRALSALACSRSSCLLRLPATLDSAALARSRSAAAACFWHSSSPCSFLTWHTPWMVTMALPQVAWCASHSKPRRNSNVIHHQQAVILDLEQQAEMCRHLGSWRHLAAQQLASPGLLYQVLSSSGSRAAHFWVKNPHSRGFEQSQREHFSAAMLLSGHCHGY